MNLNRRTFAKTAVIGSMGNLALFNTQAQNLPIKNETLAALSADVIVVGAGPSGVPAAIAAARGGAKVILLEEDMVPGGAPVDMYVALLCGGPRVGIYREMTEALNAKYEISGKPIDRFDAGNKGGCNYWYLPSSYVQVLLNMIAKEKNIRLMCGAKVVSVLTGGSRQVEGVSVEFGTTVQTIKAPVTIDATGTGIVAELAGCQTMYGRDGRHAFNEPFGPDEADTVTQRCTWMYISQRLRPDAVFPRDEIKGGGMVENNLNHWVGGMWEGKKDDYMARNAGIYLHWGASLLCEDTRNPVALAQTQLKAMQIMEPDIAALQQAGYTVHLAPKLGVREVRRVIGDYVLTVNDLKSGKLPQDTIALTEGGIDVHQTPPLTTEQIVIPLAGIPYRCLLPKDTEGLLLAGKSFSCTSYALGACRVQPVVASIGQAAGTAAAMAVKNKTGVKNIDIDKLQQTLKMDGILK